MQTSDSRTRLRRLGQVDLGDWITLATGDELWTIQKEIASALSEPNARVNVPSCVASGKALRSSEPVLTPKGWREIGSLMVGDEVYAPDGSPTAVVGVYPQGPRQLYRVTFSDGTFVDADGEHLWTIRERRSEWKTVNTLRLAALAVKQQHGEVSFPTTAPVQFPASAVPLDPYTVGLLLGDGGLTLSTPIFSTADPELLDAIPYETKHRSNYDYAVIGIAQQVRDLGMAGKRAHEKAVPGDYLWNSPEVRLAVLQGLLDTDGGISGQGVEFSSTSRQLIEDVAFLARSLGGWAGPVRDRVTTYTYKGEKRSGRESYRIALRADFPLFRLARKAAQHAAIVDKRKNTYDRALRSVEPIDVDEAVCIAVAHPSSLYITRDFNVTHNTFLAGRLALAFFDAYSPGTPCDICEGPCGGAKVITTSSKWEHLKDNLWGEIRQAYFKALEKVGFDGKMPPADLRFEHTPGHFIIGQVATAAESFQGYHAPHILVIGDEATSVSEAVSQGITGVLASGDARLLLIYNPTDTTTYAAQMSRASRTQVIRITAYDTPGFTGEGEPEGANLINQLFLDDLVDQGMGPGTYEWTTRVEAKFWDLTDDTLVAEPWYISSLTRPPEPGIKSIGIDLASYGSAESVIAFRDGNTVTAVKAFPSQRVDHFFQGPVTQAVQSFKPHYVIYDADGVGAGAVGYAEALYRHLPVGAQVIGFRGAKKLMDAYTNARSAWYWHLRRLFESGDMAMLIDDPTLKKQLTQIRYSIQNGAIRIETKDEMRKRGFASPDRADALMYAFAFSGVLSMPVVQSESPVADFFGVSSRGDQSMWERDMENLNREASPELHPLLGADW